MLQETDNAAANRELVLSYMKASQSQDFARMRELLTEDAIRYFPRPGFRPTSTTEGRDNITKNVPHVNLYQPGTMKMNIENIIATDRFVVVQFSLSAITARDEPYENYYVQVFEVEAGRIAKYWEYCDTLYGAKLLRPEMLAEVAGTLAPGE